MSEPCSHHSTAVIHPATRIDPSATIGAYAVIEDGVELGAGVIIGEHAVIRSGTILGKQVRVDAGAVIGGLPQDLTFDPRTPTGVRIGDGTVLREGVTISRATEEGQMTEIGARCFLMANAHIGHDGVLEDDVILANGVLIAGRVRVGRKSFLGGNAAVHQHVRIGPFAMVSGLGRISVDVPPFSMVSERNHLSGLNLVGLRRAGWSRESISEVKKAWHLVFDLPGNRRKYAEAALADDIFSDPMALEFLNFFLEGNRGFSQPE